MANYNARQVYFSTFDLSVEKRGGSRKTPGFKLEIILDHAPQFYWTFNP